MSDSPAGNAVPQAFLGYVVRGVASLSPLAWLFLIGGGGCLLLMAGGLAYYLTQQRQMPRLSLYVLEDGERYFRDGDPAAARREFEAAVAVSPADTQNLVNLGVADYALGDRDAAVAAFRDALRYDADHPEASYYLGVLYLQAGRLDDAIALIERSVAVRSGPAASPAWNDLGVAYERKGQPGRALECFRRALEFDPNSRLARQNLERLARLHPEPAA